MGGGGEAEEARRRGCARTKPPQATWPPGRRRRRWGSVRNLLAGAEAAADHPLWAAPAGVLRKAARERARRSPAAAAWRTRSGAVFRRI